MRSMLVLKPEDKGKQTNITAENLTNGSPVLLASAKLLKFTNHFNSMIHDVIQGRILCTCITLCFVFLGSLVLFLIHQISPKHSIVLLGVQ